MIAEIREQGFRASVDFKGDRVDVVLTGTADGRAAKPLAEMLPSLHARVVEAQANKVVVDVTELEFMNSACFKSFVSWIGSAEEGKHLYQIVFASSPKQLWQRRSLHALVCFAPRLVSIERRD